MCQYMSELVCLFFFAVVWLQSSHSLNKDQLMRITVDSFLMALSGLFKCMYYDYIQGTSIKKVTHEKRQTELGNRFIC